MAWLEKDFEEKMTPHIDEIYKKEFKGVQEIKRSDRCCAQDSKEMLMDRELSIDTVIEFDDGSIITLQEKTRDNYYLMYDDFTFEYYNDPLTKEKGEWFKLTSQYYFYGFADKEKRGYEKYYIVDVARLRMFLKDIIGIEKLERYYLEHNTPPAKANFFAIPFKEIPESCIIIRGCSKLEENILLV